MENPTRFANPVNVINALDNHDFPYSVADLQNAKRYAKIKAYKSEIINKLDTKINQLSSTPLKEQPHVCSCQDHLDEDTKRLIQYRAGIIK